MPCRNVQQRSSLAFLFEAVHLRRLSRFKSRRFSVSSPRNNWAARVDILLDRLLTRSELSIAALNFYNAFVPSDDIGNAPLPCTGFQRYALGSDLLAKFFNNRFLCSGALPGIFGKPSGLDSGSCAARHAWYESSSRVDNQTTHINGSPSVVSGR